MKKIIVFDVDRTLVDSFNTDLSRLKDAIEIVIKRNLTINEQNDLSTLPTKDFFKSINLSDNKLDLVRIEWDKTFSKYKNYCFNGIKELLENLYKNDYVLAIITSRNKEEFRMLDEVFKDITRYFKVIITSDMIKLPKPSVDSMSYLCDKLNCMSDDVIYIGDSKIDKEFAMNSNCTFIPACWENKELINEQNACLSPLDITNMLKKK